MPAPERDLRARGARRRRSRRPRPRAAARSRVMFWPFSAGSSWNGPSRQAADQAVGEARHVGAQRRRRDDVERRAEPLGEAVRVASLDRQAAVADGDRRVGRSHRRERILSAMPTPYRSPLGHRRARAVPRHRARLRGQGAAAARGAVHRPGPRRPRGVDAGRRGRAAGLRHPGRARRPRRRLRPRVRGVRGDLADRLLAASARPSTRSPRTTSSTTPPPGSRPAGCRGWWPASWSARSRCREPGAGSDLRGIATSAVRDGDDFIVNGSKTFITNGLLANLLMTVVRTDPDAGLEGLHAADDRDRRPRGLPPRAAC